MATFFFWPIMASIEKILKFGGTSVGTPERLGKVSQIILDSAANANIGVAVSAMSGTTKAEGTTSRLIQILDAARESDIKTIEDTIADISRFHLNMIEQTVDVHTIKEELVHFVNEELKSLELFAKALAEIQEISPRSRDRVIALGEILSARILTGVINAKSGKTIARFLNLKNLQPKDHVDELDSAFFRDMENRLGDTIQKESGLAKILIMTGYIGKIPGGIVESIGRGYTDYTAALAAAGSGAKSLEIWKEVDGIFSSDPRKIPEAHVLEQISYAEAAELTFFGTEAIHPRTMEPCIRKEIPIRVKNVLNPPGVGTLVSKEQKPSSVGVGKALTRKNNITVISIESNRMLEAPGFFYKVAQVFYNHKISIDLMATSEVSISFTISDLNAEKLSALEKDLSAFGNVSVLKNLSSISIIGHGMQHKIGIAGEIFSLMGKNKINIVLISQGASELSISFVVTFDQSDEAMKILHRDILQRK